MVFFRIFDCWIFYIFYIRNIWMALLARWFWFDCSFIVIFNLNLRFNRKIMTFLMINYMTFLIFILTEFIIFLCIVEYSDYICKKTKKRRIWLLIWKYLESTQGTYSNLIFNVDHVFVFWIFIVHTMCAVTIVGSILVKICHKLIKTKWHLVTAS